MTPGAKSGVPAFLWCDIESTGLEPDAPILEVGLRVTDTGLATLAERSWVVPWPANWVRAKRDTVDPVVRDMHDANGLWDECVAAPSGAARMGDGWGHQDIKTGIYQFVDTWALGLPMAGSSVRVDRGWLTSWVGIDSLLHYRIVDISSVRILARAWRPDLTALEPVPQGRHRVMPDLDDSIALARFYQQHVFHPVVAS